MLKAGGTKLEVIDTWAGATKTTALAALEADGLEAVDLPAR